MPRHHKRAEVLSDPSGSDVLSTDALDGQTLPRGGPHRRLAPGGRACDGGLLGASSRQSHDDRPELCRRDPPHRDHAGASPSRRRPRIAAMLCFNFFFLPPVGTLTIADPQNWVALLAFLATAIVASQLSGRARIREHRGARAGSAISSGSTRSAARCCLSEGGGSRPGVIARHVADAFGLRGVGIYDQRRDTISWAGSAEFPASDDKLREVARRGIAIREPDGLQIIAIQLGGQSIGSVGDHGRRPERHGAALDRQPGGDRSGAGAGRGGDGACRGGAPQQRAARDDARRPRARIQDAVDVDESRGGRSADEHCHRRPATESSSRSSTRSSTAFRVS